MKETSYSINSPNACTLFLYIDLKPKDIPFVDTHFLTCICFGKNHPD